MEKLCGFFMYCNKHFYVMHRLTLQEKKGLIIIIKEGKKEKK